MNQMILCTSFFSFTILMDIYVILATVLMKKSRNFAL